MSTGNHARNDTRGAAGAGTSPAAPRPAPTPSQTIGPFYGFALPFPRGEQTAPAHRSDAITVHGTVIDGAGRPVPDALLEFWQADPDGSLAGAPGSLRRDGYGFTGFARVPTAPDGHWVLRTLPPGAPGGQARCAPYLSVAVFARGVMHHLFTRVYFPRDTAAHAADPLLSALDEARRRTLIADEEEDGVLRFDIRLQGEEETVFLEFP